MPDASSATVAEALVPVNAGQLAQALQRMILMRLMTCQAPLWTPGNHQVNCCDCKCCYSASFWDIHLHAKVCFGCQHFGRRIQEQQCPPHASSFLDRGSDSAFLRQCTQAKHQHRLQLPKPKLRKAGAHTCQWPHQRQDDFDGIKCS